MNVFSSTGNTLLEYRLLPSPNPLQVSPDAGDLLKASLEFVVSNGSDEEVALSQVRIIIPCGEEALQLTNDPAAIKFAVTSSVPAEEWVITKDAEPGVYLIRPRDGQPIVLFSQGLHILFYQVPVNRMIGTVTIKLEETAANVSTPAPALRHAEFKEAKFPYGFFVNNFAPNVPLVQFDQSVTLTWQGSTMTDYTIQSGPDAPVNVSDQRSWQSPGLKQDTTFLLTAKVTFQGETVTHVLSATVIVADPDLLGTTLHVKGVSHLEGTTTIGTVGSSVLTLSGTQTTVNSPVTIHGDLSASKLGALNEIKLSDATNSQNIFTINAAAGEINTPKFVFKKEVTLEDWLYLNGHAKMAQSLQVGGKVAVTGPMDILSNLYDRGMKAGAYTAQCDGLLIAYITAWKIDPKYKSWGWINIVTSLGGFNLTTGTMKWTDGNHVGTSAITLPIGMGDGFSVSYGFPKDSGYQTPTIKFYFVGIGNTVQPTPRPLTEEEEKKLAEPVINKIKPRRKAADVAAAVIKAVKSDNHADLETILREDLGLE